MPFSDLTVLDIATLGAAPQIAAFFGDFGARVVKIEHPRGDALRKLADRSGVSLAWKIHNRNKLFATLDLGRADGREVFERMLAKADLLVCALTAARMRAWGLEPEELARRHPRLVVVNLTTYGATGPWAERPGSGTLAEAAGGLAALTGEKEGPPTLSPVGLGDFLGVLQGIVAALLGLYAREKGRGGDLFDVAMLDPILALLSLRLAAAARDGKDFPRSGNRFPTVAPRNTYRTRDGRWVALTAGTDSQVARVFEVLGRPELARDPRFATNAERVRHVEELDALVADWVGRRTQEEVVEAFVRAGVSLAPVHGLLDVLRNPHLLERGSFVEVEDEEAGRLLLPRPGPAGSRTRPRTPTLAGQLGADNELVYREWLGLGADELERLRSGGIV